MDGMQNDLSQKIDNLQYSISRLTNLNTVQEKGRFPSQPHQNPKGIHEVETHEGESSQEEEEETEKREEIKGKKKDISEGKEDHDSTVNANPEKSPLKYKDGLPTISVMIGGKVVEKALLDLGASVNLLPYSVYKQLGLGELKPTSITLSLADRSVKIPRGIIEDVLVQVDNFYYPVDFVVLDTDPIVKETNYVPIILGRPFLATSNAIINCRNGLMQLTFGNMTLSSISSICQKAITPEEEEGPEEKGCLNPQYVLATLQGWRREEILPLFNKEEAQEAAKEETPKLNLKPLPMELKYTYLEEITMPCCYIFISYYSQEMCLLEVLKRCKKAIGWQISDLKGISPLLLQRYYYPISDSPWVSPTQVVPKKSGITVVQNEKEKNCYTPHFRLEVLERVSGHPFYCFLEVLGYFQIEIDVEDQEKTTFTCPFGTYAYRRMPFGLCNAPATFQRCMLSIFSDMVERIMEKCHFMVHQGIVLGHIISEKGIEVDKAKVELIVKLPSPTTVKGVRQFLGHAGFYRSDFAIGAVLGQREDGKPYVIYYASKTLNEAQRNYTTTEKELLAVVFALDKFRAY
ncbi:Retrovirus-related Pol polyprotein from transposon 297 [Vitis vinifera]|uniref:Retrovirus-related Pol polyprotein from transposon 297 n=1 Tax=Vitis vinifera TaxID=29760 RepID=A0A438G2Y3_VITVI|nr:Retrovirus-related Pol polyprotein from transposon 297 [Vitis vinifera]